VGGDAVSKKVLVGREWGKAEPSTIVIGRGNVPDHKCILMCYVTFTMQF